MFCLMLNFQALACCLLLMMSWIQSRLLEISGTKKQNTDIYGKYQEVVTGLLQVGARKF